MLEKSYNLFILSSFLHTVFVRFVSPYVQWKRIFLKRKKTTTTTTVKKINRFLYTVLHILQCKKKLPKFVKYAKADKTAKEKKITKILIINVIQENKCKHFPKSKLTTCV